MFREQLNILKTDHNKQNLVINCTDSIVLVISVVYTYYNCYSSIVTERQPINEPWLIYNQLSYSLQIVYYFTKILHQCFDLGKDQNTSF